ncbi:orotidine-5'-phosphate decarboxylase [bacterium]|nr:orotidine-5'-phosphate decarboxylase [bacterium]|tara:strand:+ start:3770 stop:4459 length:690 start_codon:yes stop_codon:yes gene_type:complete
MSGKNFPISLALDTGSQSEAVKWIDFFSEWVGSFKVGPVLFHEWPGVIDYIKNKNKIVFLDLKLHDIPNTVFLATKSLSKQNVDYMTIHMSGGKDMVSAAVEGGGSSLCPIGVGVLTSVSSRSWHSFTGQKISDSFNLMLSYSWDAGLKNFVCSGSEVKVIRANFPNCKIWVPGVRFKGDLTDDQKRITTPKDAIDDGANWLVIGRALYNSSKNDVIHKMKLFEKELFS